MAVQTKICATAMALLMAVGIFAASGSGETAAQSATSAPVAAGDVLSPDVIHIIERPGLYGLGPELHGSRYAVANGYLIRIDPNTLKVLSVLRVQNRVLD